MSEKTRKPKAPKGQTKPVRPEPTVETGALDDAPMLGAAAPVLGTLSGESDSQLDVSTEAPKSEAPAQAPKSSIRKKQADKKQKAPDKPETPAPTPSVLSAEPPPETPPEPLRLPRSAFVGLRKSGGLKFSTREVVVYPDGRVAYDARGVPQKEYTRLRRVLNDGQVHSLRKLLDQTNFWMTASAGKQNPDAFAYEITARLNQRSNEIEVFDGSVPENIQPLLEFLNKLLPE